MWNEKPTPSRMPRTGPSRLRGTRIRFPLRTACVIGVTFDDLRKAHNFFMFLDSSAFVAGPALIAVLWKHAISLDCAEDLELFRQGADPSGLFFLHSGEATMVMENEFGDHVARALMEPGSILGLPALVSDKPYSMGAVAKRGSTVGFVSRDDFSSLMLTEPALAMMILRVLAAEVRGSRVALTEWRTAPRRGRGMRRKRAMAGSRSQTAN
jgi:CRP-like cAMP-binding protein